MPPWKILWQIVSLFVTSSRSAGPHKHPLAGVAALNEHVAVKLRYLFSLQTGSQMKPVDVLAHHELDLVLLDELGDGHVSRCRLQSKSRRFERYHGSFQT